MYILKNTDNLPVSNIIFLEDKLFDIKTRFINENKFELGIFKKNNFHTGWNYFISFYYFETKINSNQSEKKYLYKTTIGPSNISSKIIIINTKFKLKKKKLKEVINKSLKIPRIIIQTHKNLLFKNREYYDASRSWILKNPGYTYIFYDNNDCQEFLLKYFNPIVSFAWYKIKPGAFKADLFRYCILLILGGIYADFDTICVKPIEEIIDPNTFSLFIREPDNRYHMIWNAIIFSSKNNPIFKKCIDICVSNILTRRYPKSHLNLTGPGVLGSSLNLINNKYIYMKHSVGTHIKNGHNYIIGQNTNINRIINVNNTCIAISKWIGYNENDNSYWNKKNWY